MRTNRNRTRNKHRSGYWRERGGWWRQQKWSPNGCLSHGRRTTANRKQVSRHRCSPPGGQQLRCQTCLLGHNGVTKHAQTTRSVRVFCRWRHPLRRRGASKIKTSSCCTGAEVGKLWQTIRQRQRVGKRHVAVHPTPRQQKPAPADERAAANIGSQSNPLQVEAPRQEPPKHS